MRQHYALPSPHIIVLIERVCLKQKIAEAFGSECRRPKRACYLLIFTLDTPT
jgi:hypothetical protein